MFGKLMNAMEGYKTHGLVVLGIAVALAGHYWGPFSIGSLQVPAFSWNEVIKIVWSGGLFSALHAQKGA